MLCATVGLACSPSALTATRSSADDPQSELTPPDDPRITALPFDGLSCTERVPLPRVEQIDNVFDAKWADNSSTIAVSRIVTIPNARMITGTEEDQRISLIDVATGSVRDLGKGSKPAWSGGGIYLSYWREGDDDLRIMLGNRLAGLVPSTQPEARWVGDELYFFHNGEIRVWKNGSSWTIANVIDDLAPKYPRDDVYFSADGQRFTMTRYFSSGDVERYLGTTSTGAMEPLGDGNTLFTQWAPNGHALLLRSTAAVSLLKEDGQITSAPTAALPGPVHGWTNDGRLIFGRMSATIPSASSFDKFAVFGDEQTVAALPNLLGVRARRASRPIHVASCVRCRAPSRSTSRGTTPASTSPPPWARSSWPPTTASWTRWAGCRSVDAACACSIRAGSRAATTTPLSRSCPSATLWSAASPSRSSA